VAEAGKFDFELVRFEHLVETERGHIVRVSGTWAASAPRDLPHPTLLAGEGDGSVSVAPLPIPGQEPPHPDGETVWLATYSIPKRLFEDDGPPRCRLQLAADVVIDLPALVVPEGGGEHAVPLRPFMPAPAPGGPAATAAATTAPVAGRPAKRGGGLVLPALRAHRRVAMGIVALAVVGSLIGLAVRSPRYEAASLLLITPVPRDDTTLDGLNEVRAGSDPEQTIQTVARLIDSRQAAIVTARRLGDGWNVQRVREAISVTPKGQSNVLEVRATADDGPLAARVANTFATTSVAQRDRRLRALATAALARSNTDLAAVPDQGGEEAQALRLRIAQLERIRQGSNPTLDLVQAAAVPRSAAGLPAPAIVLLSALAGLILAGGLAMLLDLIGPGRIDDERELRALYPLPVLTRVPALPPRRLRPDAPELREPFRTLHVQLELDPGRHRAVMITSASTGDGKTTTSLAFALALASAGREVILVDLDLRKPDLAQRLGVEAGGLEDVVAGRRALADALVRIPGSERLELLAPAGGGDLSTLEAVARQLPEIVEGATALADYVVLDTPPVGEVSDALTFAPSADDLLVVSRLGRTPRASFEAMRDVLERVDARPSGLIVIGGATLPSPSYELATGEALSPQP